MSHVHLHTRRAFLHCLFVFLLPWRCTGEAKEKDVSAEVLLRLRIEALERELGGEILYSAFDWGALVINLGSPVARTESMNRAVAAQNELRTRVLEISEDFDRQI